MLDLKFVRENLDKVAEAMKNRHTEVDLDAFRKLDQERRDLLQEVEADKSMRNSVSAEISKMKKMVKTLRRRSFPCVPLEIRLLKRTRNSRKWNRDCVTSC